MTILHLIISLLIANWYHQDSKQVLYPFIVCLSYLFHTNLSMCCNLKQPFMILFVSNGLSNISNADFTCWFSMSNDSNDELWIISNLYIRIAWRFHFFTKTNASLQPFFVFSSIEFYSFDEWTTKSMLNIVVPNKMALINNSLINISLTFFIVCVVIWSKMCVKKVEH